MHITTTTKQSVILNRDEYIALNQTKDIPFIILYKGQTETKCNYFKLLVQLDEGLWKEAYYFGNTVPKNVTATFISNNGRLKVDIQVHTSRDKNTGKFKGARK